MHGSQLTLALGPEEGRRVGDRGRLCTTRRVGAKSVEICLATFEITSVSGNSAFAKLLVGDPQELAIGLRAQFDPRTEPSAAGHPGPQPSSGALATSSGPPRPNPPPTPKDSPHDPDSITIEERQTLESGDPVSLLELGNRALTRGRAPAAVTLFESLLARVPADPIASRQLREAKSLLERNKNPGNTASDQQHLNYLRAARSAASQLGDTPAVARYDTEIAALANSATEKSAPELTLAASSSIAATEGSTSPGSPTTASASRPSPGGPMLIDLPLPQLDLYPPGGTRIFQTVETFVCDGVSLKALRLLRTNPPGAKVAKFKVSGSIYVEKSFDRYVDLEFLLRVGEKRSPPVVLRRIDAEETKTTPFVVTLSLPDENLRVALPGGHEIPHLSITVSVTSNE